MITVTAAADTITATNVVCDHGISETDHRNVKLTKKNTNTQPGAWRPLLLCNKANVKV